MNQINQNKIIVTNLEGTKVLCLKGFIENSKLETYSIRTFNTKYEVECYLERYYPHIKMEDIQCFKTKINYNLDGIAY